MDILEMYKLNSYCYLSLTLSDPGWGAEFLQALQQKLDKQDIKIFLTIPKYVYTYFGFKERKL